MFALANLPLVPSIDFETQPTHIHLALRHLEGLTQVGVDQHSMQSAAVKIRQACHFPETVSWMHVKFYRQPGDQDPSPSCNLATQWLKAKLLAR